MMEHTDPAKPSGLQTIQLKVHFISYTQRLICASVTRLDHTSERISKVIQLGLISGIFGLGLHNTVEAANTLKKQNKTALM